MPLLDGEEPVTLGEGWTPLIHARRLGAAARARPAVRQGRVAQPDQLLQGARPRRRGDPRVAPRRAGRCRFPRPATPPTRWPPTRPPRASRRKVFMPRDVKVPFIRECELYGARRHARRRPDHRRRPDRRRARQAARLVRRLDAQGAVPHRGQEDDGLRARRAARLAVPRLDHLSDRRRHRHGRHVEGVRGARAHRLEDRDARPQMVSVQAEHCAPIVRAFDEGAERSRAVAERAHGRRRPCACRRRSATSSCCAPCARAAAPRSRCRDADMVRRHARARRDRRHQRRARRRRRAARAARAARATAASSRPTPSSSSTPAAP